MSDLKAAGLTLPSNLEAVVERLLLIREYSEKGFQSHRTQQHIIGRLPLEDQGRVMAAVVLLERRRKPIYTAPAALSGR